LLFLQCKEKRKIKIATQFSQIIYAALFVPPSFPIKKGNRICWDKKGWQAQIVKSTVIGKHGNIRKRQTSNPAQRPAGQGQEMCC